MNEKDHEYMKKLYNQEVKFDVSKFNQLKKEESKKNKEIEKELSLARERQKMEFVLLLLGTGESGKSTIAKQLRIVNKEKFTKEERKGYTTLIHSNVIGSIKKVIRAHGKFEDPSLQEIADKLLNEDLPFNSDTVLMIETILSNSDVQKTLSRGAEYHLDDSATYFFYDLRRLCSEGYIPSQQDVLRCRQKTTGIKETFIKVDEAVFRIVDVGGQKNERRKWIHVFEGVTAVIFCADIACYDQVLVEDGKTNRMYDSLQVFTEICNNKWFLKSDIILFLNKKDIFEEKIKTVPLSVNPHFDDVQDIVGYNDSLDYISKKYLACNTNKKRVIYWHVTCATNTSSMEVVFNAVKSIILRKALERSGLAI